MAHVEHDHIEHSGGRVGDPCGVVGPRQKWAVVWCMGALLAGSMLTITLSQIDAHNFETNGEHLDMKAYKENRLAATSLRSETIDERQFGDNTSVLQRLMMERQ